MKIFGTYPSDLVHGYREMSERDHENPLVGLPNLNDGSWARGIRISVQFSADDILNPPESNPEDSTLVQEVILYGLYQLKISPNEFSSEKEYLHEVLKENEELITDDDRRDYIHRLLTFIESNDLSADEVYNDAAKFLKRVCGLTISVEYKTKEELVKKMKSKMEHLLATEKYKKNKKPSRSVTKKSTLQTPLMVVGAVAIVGALAFFLRKKFSK